MTWIIRILWRESFSNLFRQRCGSVSPFSLITRLGSANWKQCELTNPRRTFSTLSPKQKKTWRSFQVDFFCSRLFMRHWTEIVNLWYLLWLDCEQGLGVEDLLAEPWQRAMRYKDETRTLLLGRWHLQLGPKFFQTHGNFFWAPWMAVWGLSQVFSNTLIRRRL